MDGNFLAGSLGDFRLPVYRRHDHHRPQGTGLRASTRAEEALFDDITLERYMDHLVDQTVLILTNEPADIYANPTFLPDTMANDYDKYWTDGRIERVLDVLQQHGIALEINARYRIPSFENIRRAKARGIKFTFGTNNVDADFGRRNTAPKPSSNAASQPTKYGFRR